jgi:hypothetical protein
LVSCYSSLEQPCKVRFLAGKYDERQDILKGLRGSVRGLSYRVREREEKKNSNHVFHYKTFAACECGKLFIFLCVRGASKSNVFFCYFLKESLRRNRKKKRINFYGLLTKTNLTGGKIFAGLKKNNTLNTFSKKDTEAIKFNKKNIPLRNGLEV